VCYEVFREPDRTPLILPCGHSYCRRCLRKLHKHGRVECPACRRTIRIDSLDNLIRNYNLNTRPSSRPVSATIARCLTTMDLKTAVQQLMKWSLTGVDIHIPLGWLPLAVSQDQADEMSWLISFHPVKQCADRLKKQVDDQEFRDTNHALEYLVNHQASGAFLSGFFTGTPLHWTTSLVLLPIGMVSTLFFSCRLTGIIAEMEGHDVQMPETQLKIIACLLGDEGCVATLRKIGVYGGSQVPPWEWAHLLENVVYHLIAKAGGTRLFRSIPAFGSLLGGVLDGKYTMDCARRARAVFRTPMLGPPGGLPDVVASAVRNVSRQLLGGGDQPENAGGGLYPSVGEGEFGREVQGLLGALRRRQ